MEDAARWFSYSRIASFSARDTCREGEQQRQSEERGGIGGEGGVEGEGKGEGERGGREREKERGRERESPRREKGRYIQHSKSTVHVYTLCTCMTEQSSNMYMYIPASPS